VRISGGGARGIELAVPGTGVRPATDALRQAVFSSLGERVTGAWFLDLFAGSGSYGLEALSRGAAGGTFVERDRKAVDCLRRNLAAVCKSLRRSEQDLVVLPVDASTAPRAGSEVPDLVFVDPPYEIIEKVAPRLFGSLTALLRSKPDALVVFEVPGQMSLSPDGWTQVKRIGKGGRQPTAIIFKALSLKPLDSPLPVPEPIHPRTPQPGSDRP
jgi:16S rRNA (guanine966-N2)-methyltransferase